MKSMKGTWNAVAACVGVMGIAAATYAGCCFYTGNWQSPETECFGTGTTWFCEYSSPSCGDGPSSNYSCMKNWNGIRKAQCTTIQPAVPSQLEWARIDCTQGSPGQGWVFIARNPDGSCCWVKNAIVTNSDANPVSYVSICTKACTGGGGSQ